MGLLFVSSVQFDPIVGSRKGSTLRDKANATGAVRCATQLLGCSVKDLEQALCYRHIVVSVCVNNDRALPRAVAQPVS